MKDGGMGWRQCLLAQRKLQPSLESPCRDTVNSDTLTTLPDVIQVSISSSSKLLWDKHLSCGWECTCNDG